MHTHSSSIRKTNEINLPLLTLAVLIGLSPLTGCNGPQQHAQKQQAKNVDTGAKRPDTTGKTATPPSTDQTALTLPVLDALFYEPGFALSLRSKIGLTAAQVGKLKASAHASLRELSEDGNTDTVSTRTAIQRYQAQIRKIIGDDKTAQLQQLVVDRYSQGVSGLAPAHPNFVPADTRIVVNAPAFRMDVFQNGKLLKSYRIGIGYPEFPLPTGMRRADSIVFNPSWTPPDEPWVKGKFAPGKKIAGDNELNPLGVIKIPIGMPSLIHGGKALEKIGSFASHGCVGLTNAQVKDFSAMLAQLGASGLSAENIRSLEKHKTKTRLVNLSKPVPVDLRYETIVAGNGMLHIYRDVYERGTNTLTAAKRILAVWDIAYEQLNDQEKSDLNDALNEMNRDPRGNPIATDSIPPSKDGVPASKLARAKKGKVTPKIKGEKKADVPITALQGIGYPEPTSLDTGSPVKAKS